MQTTVSEDQGNPEETTQEEVSEDEAVPANESDAITDFETAYKAYTFGANVSGPDAISADKNTVAVFRRSFFCKLCYFSLRGFFLNTCI